MIFTIIDSISYSYVPIFIQYIVSILTKDTNPINLPEFILNFLNSGDTLYIKVIYGSIALAVYQILRALLKVASTITKNLLSENLVRSMRHELYAHIQKLPYSYHANSDNGDLIQRCTNDIDVVKNAVCNQLPEVVWIFSIVISSIYQMTRINTKLTLVSLIIVPVSILTSYLYFKFVSKKYEEVEKIDSKLTSVIEQNINNVRVVKACNNEQFEIEKFSKLNYEQTRASYELSKVSAFFWGFSDCVTFTQYLITCVVAIALARSGDTSIGMASFAAMISLVGSYIWPIRSLGRIIGDTGKSSVSAGRLKEILNNKDEFINNNGKLFPEFTGKIEFKNVSFKFDDTEEHLLQNISFDVNPGEVIAIMGKTGSGKSTIAKLLTRMLEADMGEILLDDINIKEIEKQHLRRNVGLVLQEPFLFAKTVSENIGITNKSTSTENIEKVAKMSAVHNDILGFEKGYDTIVGEKGVTLSGGQKQRIAIARMLLDDKAIIIFDDSLSALDTETDLMIRNALKSRDNKSTTFIITHRISTARSADKIIVLENGEIGAIGKHEELINKDGLYKKLWDIQGNIEEEFLKLLNEEVE